MAGPPSPGPGAWRRPFVSGRISPKDVFMKIYKETVFCMQLWLTGGQDNRVIRFCDHELELPHSPARGDPQPLDLCWQDMADHLDCVSHRPDCCWWRINILRRAEQIILVTTPSLLYLCYAIHKIARMAERNEKRSKGKNTAVRWKRNRALEETEDDHEEDPMMYPEMEMESEKETQSPDNDKAKHDGRRRIRADGLMKIYVLQLLIRTAFEIAFLVGQYFLYGFEVIPKFTCSTAPCNHTVDCFVSRPTEKTIFLLIMYGVSCLCLLLNVLEMIHLGFGTIRDTLSSKKKVLEEPTSYAYPFTWNTPSAPPGYNIAVKPDQIQYTELSNAKMAYKQNKANIAQEQQYGSHDENIPPNLENLQREIRVAQERLDLAIQIYNTQSNQGSLKEKKAKPCSSKSSSSSKAGEGKAKSWL
ncbi:hypothetical protein NDU88_002895 [Pleurodeles waltl]|uniref:Gap junction protein n=1 Tax=Pleurodeles waltl TaxID=8319 RepID=A0AAV7QA72_PLEWA|nr:hypothetical protein NDU88_002895 [Pleurodeles waltl]